MKAIAMMSTSQSSQFVVLGKTMRGSESAQGALSKAGARGRRFEFEERCDAMQCNVQEGGMELSVSQLCSQKHRRLVRVL